MYTNILTDKDYYNRIRSMQDKVAEKGLDAVLIFANEAEPANVRYFTNYRPVFESTGVVIPRTGDALLLIGPETEELAQDHSVLKKFMKLLEFRESSDPDYPDIEQDTFDDVFKNMNDGQGVKKLGLIGTNIMSVQVYEGIIRALPKAILSKEDNLLRDMRMIKSPQELLILEKAAGIAGRGFEYAMNRIKPGMSEYQAAAECMYGVYSYGAEGTGFNIWCVSGKATKQAIGLSTGKIIQKEEIVQISMGVMIEGYVSSFGRVLFFGRMQPEVKRLLETGLHANAMTHNLIKPGANASEVATEVQDYIREQGMGDYIVYGPAHGIGMMECEFPFIESTSNFIIQEGMSFAVDTFLAGPHFGMRFEDTAAVSKTGVNQFCDFKREIINL
jgi:Xaa-Pro aminopeptidase